MALQSCSIWNMQTFLSGTYHIPDYQREYSWEADELSDFWDDLEATRNDSDQLVHFFGQIVVHNDEKAKYIIDGQQRTITSVIFLRALQLCYLTFGFISGEDNKDYFFHKSMKTFNVSVSYELSYCLYSTILTSFRVSETATVFIGLCSALGSPQHCTCTAF